MGAFCMVGWVQGPPHHALPRVKGMLWGSMGLAVCHHRTGTSTPARRCWQWGQSWLREHGGSQASCGCEGGREQGCGPMGGSWLGQGGTASAHGTGSIPQGPWALWGALR